MDTEPLCANQLLESWRVRIHNLKRAQYAASARFWFWNKVVAIIITLTSTSILPLNYLAVTQEWFKHYPIGIAIAALGLISAVLATLQLFFRFSERVEQHRASGATYAKLETKIEMLCAFPPASEESLQKEVKDFHDEWAKLTGGGPAIPARIFNKYCAAAEEQLSRHQV